MPLMPLDANDRAVPVLRPGATTTVAVASASAASAVFGASVVRMTSTVDCYVLIGTTPVALTTSMYLPAGVPFDIRVVPSVDKIAVIRRSTDGVLHLTEMA